MTKTSLQQEDPVVAYRRLDFSHVLLITAAAAVACGTVAVILFVQMFGWWTIPIALVVALCIRVPQAGLVVAIGALMITIGVAALIVFAVGLFAAPLVTIPAFLILTYIIEPERW